ncbi:MAG: hypothetical protein AMXMBFR47_34670 [Planctomycetota bacterium]
MIPGLSGLIAGFCGWAGTADGACALWIVPGLLSYVNGALTTAMPRAIAISATLAAVCLAGYFFAIQLPVSSVAGPTSIPTRSTQPATRPAAPPALPGESSSVPMLVVLLASCLLFGAVGRAFAQRQQIELATAPRCPRCRNLIDRSDEICRACGMRLR